MDPSHSLLKRQIKRYFRELSNIPKQWQDFFDAVNDAYCQFDEDRAMLERSLELSSKELIRANSDMRAVINSSVDGILAFDRDYRYTVWNPGMERITGVSKGHVLGQSITETFSVFKETGEEISLYESLTGKTIAVKDKPYIMPGTGKRGFFEGYYSPMRDDSGAIIGGLAIIRDVTERKEAEDTLRRRSAALIRHQHALLKLAKMNISDMQSALQMMTETDAKTQNVERVSVWFFDKTHSEIVCEDLYKKNERTHEKGMRLQARHYPKYFQALDATGIIAAKDACTDPRTREFAEN